MWPRPSEVYTAHVASARHCRQMRLFSVRNNWPALITFELMLQDALPTRHEHLFQAKRLLGWTPKHTITGDLAEYFEGYKAAGKMEAEPDFNKVGLYTMHYTVCR